MMSGPTAREVIASWCCGETEPLPDDWEAADSLIAALEDAGYRVWPRPLAAQTIAQMKSEWEAQR